MDTKEIRQQQDIRKVNYYRLGKICTRRSIYNESEAFIELEVQSANSEKGPVLFRFFDVKLLKYFVTKLKSANFKRNAMEIKYGMKLLIMLCLFLSTASFASDTTENNTRALCINEDILSEQEKDAAYDRLSYPAVSTGDPYILAVSYFNNKLYVITREDYASQYEFEDVPYSLYKTFINSDEKKDFYKRCIKDYYESARIY